MTDMNRRGWGLAVVLGGAAMGFGAWLRSRGVPLSPLPEAQAGTPGQAGPGAPAQGAIPVPLTTREGRTLTAADIGHRSVVLNFWAPWCPPCVREMPEIDRFSRSAAGKDTLVIGLAIDEKPAVDKFLAEHPVGFPIVVLGYAGLSWVRQLGNDSQALPFSVVFDRGGHKVVQRKAGATTAGELQGWVAKL
ncbi:MAG: TlpA family protein disulfide reductase [Burkholderiaceae bacterium]